MKKIFNVALLIILAGCRGYHEFIPSEIPQTKWSEEVAPPKDSGEKWIKSARFYDEFSTVALFDVMKYCDDLAVIESATKSARDGLSTSQAMENAMNAVSQNQRQLDFYMLADVRDDMGAALGKDRSPWRFWIELCDNSVVRPSLIRQILWTPEIKRLFGKCYSNFKTLYKIEFPLCGSDLDQGRKCRGPLRFALSCPGYTRKIEWPAEKGWSEAVKAQKTQVSFKPAPDRTLAKLEVYDA